ncbi:hypothetical protein AADG42_18145 [Ammonicoccus fulvus]|uniref:Uncharacterized protein n=1 Tax=Ammonicoccus fulvus TaxID=3138240 RepID=A0ABZ3FX54_9ACTN
MTKAPLGRTPRMEPAGRKPASDCRRSVLTPSWSTLERSRFQSEDAS